MSPMGVVLTTYISRPIAIYLRSLDVAAGYDTEPENIEVKDINICTSGTGSCHEENPGDREKHNGLE